MTALAKTWIVVADGAHASVLSYQGPREPLVQVEGGALEHVNEPTRELATDQRGRVYRAEGTSFARDYSSDPHEFEKVRFAGEVVEFLARRQSKFERLVLVAPPRMLGELRRQLPEAIRDRIYGELGKELTNIPVDQLPRHLQDVIYIEARD